MSPFKLTVDPLLLISIFVLYGLLPIDLFPKLTGETKDICTYLLLDDKMKVEQRVLAQTEYEVYIVPGRRTILFT